MEQFLTTHEAAMMVGVSDKTIYTWIKKGLLGNTNRQSVSRGAGCGYKIRLSDLNKYVHGWEIEEDKPEPESRTKQIKAKELKDLMIDKESMKLAASNLRIAIEFAQEELKKIEALL